MKLCRNRNIWNLIQSAGPDDKENIVHALLIAISIDKAFLYCPNKGVIK